MLKTLKGKISLIHMCLVIAIALVGSVSAVNLYGLSKTINGLVSDNYNSIHALANMTEALEKQDMAVLTYISTDKKQGLSLFTQNKNLFLKWYNVEYANVTEPEEKKPIENINKAYSEYLELFSELQKTNGYHGESSYFQFYSSKIMPVFLKIRSEIKNATLVNEAAMLNSKNEATRNAQKSTYLILILASTVVAGGFLASRFFIERFLRPIYSLTQTIKLVKAGDLNQQADISAQNEIGELAREFNNMTRRLQQYEQSALGTLIAEKNKSLTIVKSISEPLMVLDSSFNILLLNNACEKIFRVAEKDVLYKHFLEAIRNKELFEHITNVFSSNDDNIEKIIFIKLCEKDYYFNVLVSKVKDNNNQVQQLIAVFQNVTQLKQLERVKTEFIGTISHEFKTPLTSIMMGTSLILDEGLGSINNKQRDVLDAIKEDGERLTALVNDLLELSRIESGRSIFKIVPCSILGIIDSSVKHFYEQAIQKDVKLYYEANENLPKVYADYERIVWVVSNLVSNALKYTNAGDKICVSAAVKNKKMFVSVKDTGVGIPPELVEKIFDKFSQVKDHDFEARGTGLGLAIVKEIIETHSGQIWCESKLDTGSSFIFTLPLSV
ncbi:MAG: ATP-binding protein [Clostridia bacterium]|nr:ATP-binding protein [Clostridia bacterium]